MYRPANPAAITTASKFWVPTGVTMVEKQAVTPAGKVDRAGAWQRSIAICGCGDPVECRILESVEVTVGPERLDLGGVRQQIVLATLLLNPNTVVTAGRLETAIYGEDLPPTSRSQV